MYVNVISYLFYRAKNVMITLVMNIFVRFL